MLRSLLGSKSASKNNEVEASKSSTDPSSPATSRGWNLLRSRVTDGHLAGGGGEDDVGTSSSPTSHNKRSVGRASVDFSVGSAKVTTGLVWVPPVDFEYGRYISMQEFDAKWINAAKNGTEVSGTFSYSIRRGPMHEDKQKEYYRQGTNRERPWYTQQRQQGRGDDGGSSEGMVSMSISPWCQLATRLQHGGKLLDAQDEQLLRTPVLPAADPDRCTTADSNCRDDEGAVYTVRVLFKHDGKQQHEDTGDAHLHKVIPDQRMVKQHMHLLDNLIILFGDTLWTHPSHASYAHLRHNHHYRLIKSMTPSYMPSYRPSP